MRITLFVALLLAHGVAAAQNTGEPVLGYTFGEVRYINVDSGGDGWELGGSFQFNTNWFAVASFSSYDLGSAADGKSFEIGAGYVFPFHEEWDFQVDARLIRAEVDTRFASASDTGLGVLAGVRGLIAPKFEVRGNLHYVNVDDSDVFVEIGGDWYFTPEIAAGLTYNFGGNADVWTLGARFFFN